MLTSCCYCFEVQMLRPHLDVFNLLFIDYFIIIFLRTSICTGVVVLRLYFIQLFIWRTDVMTSFRCNNYFIIIVIRTSLCTGDIMLRLLNIVKTSSDLRKLPCCTATASLLSEIFSILEIIWNIFHHINIKQQNEKVTLNNHILNLFW